MIRMNKKYKTRSGLPVRVLCNDAGGKYPIVALISVDGNPPVAFRFCGDGSYTSKAHHELDLVEVSPNEDFKIDDPVMISDDSISWFKRYFAGVAPNGKAKAFCSGTTSWTNSDGIGGGVEWEFCRRPTPEELGEKE